MKSEVSIKNKKEEICKHREQNKKRNHDKNKTKDTFLFFVRVLKRFFKLRSLVLARSKWQELCGSSTFFGENSWFLF
jgi:hypothetical protein